MDLEKIIYTIAMCAPGLLAAVILHEWAHGYVAKRFGDDTAERAGRLSFNPAVHIDPMGTIFFPLICITLFSGMAFGWAKPVPINTRNFKNVRKAVFWVSFAGPLANLFLSVVSAFFVVLIQKHFSGSETAQALFEMLQYSLTINIILMGFNLIPIPPLDGSKMVASFLKGETLRKYESLAQYTSFIFLGAIALSLMGIPTIHYLLLPFMAIGEVLLWIFSQIL